MPLSLIDVSNSVSLASYKRGLTLPCISTSTVRFPWEESPALVVPKNQGIKSFFSSTLSQSFLFWLIVGIEPTTFCISSKCSTIELY